MFYINRIKLAEARKKISTSKVVILVAFSIFSILFSSINVLAQGDLLVTPRRIVFKGNKKTQSIHLANSGNKDASYMVSFRQYAMQENGTFLEVTEPEPGQNFASDYVRFFPRTVTLAPGESQTVKLQLSRTRGLEDGEYRSHIYFRSVPEEVPLGEDDPNADTTTISIQITPIFGITIPVIFRIGEPSIDISLTDLSLEIDDEGKHQLSYTINREGNQSIYGSFKVDYISEKGKKTQVGIVNGVAVYTPINSRYFKLSLSDGFDYTNGKLVIRYVSPSDLKKETYAEAELLLD